MREVWEICEEHPEFAVSDHGRVEDIEKSRLVPTRINQRGLPMVTLRAGTGRQVTRSVAILVAKVFVYVLEYDWFDSVINLNGDREDCRALNLMWRSRSFALRYHDMFKHAPYRVAVTIPELGEHYGSLREACTKYGLIEKQTYMNIMHGEPCFPYPWIMEKIEL